MKTLTQYTYSCTEAMFNYIKSNDLCALITKLKNIERHCVDSLLNDECLTDKEILDITFSKRFWFKFGESDTLVTTIEDLERDLSSRTNKDFRIESFELISGLNSKDELQVYFS